MINGEGWLHNGVKASLTVIPYEGVVTKTILEGAFNTSPSPNMPNLETAFLYKGLCLLEGTNISEGRGTDLPFMVIGAPWLNVEKVIEKLEAFKHPLDVYEITHFKPKILPHVKHPKYEGEICKGFQISYLKDPIYWTINLLEVVQSIHPQQFRFIDTNFIDKLYGSDRLRLSNEKDITIDTLLASETSHAQFIEIRKKYLIYR